MEIKDSSIPSNEKEQRSVDKAEVIQELLAFSGEKILEKIMEHDNPQFLVRILPQEDFFWLV